MPDRIGPTLRKARTERGVELGEVERVTKIRQKFLSAMETDRWNELPAPVYARGFLSTYARYLGLDEEPLLASLRETLGEQERPSHVPRGAVHAGEIGRARAVRPRGLLRWLGLVVGLLVLGLVVAAVVGGSDDNGGSKGRKSSVAQKQGPSTSTASSTAQTTTTTTATATTSEVSVELRSTADVWVCLVDARGRPLVNSETLTANQTRGPFSGTGFEMTFGNGSVDLTVNGQAVKVPSLAQPVGYRIGPDGAKRLQPSSQPSCT
jgi:cytoskeletal protein RodZ